ncbi:hypothetical protein KVQ82_06545 [Pseudomonas sp. AO-1]|uniref:hypothetical protein n=1 Tax=Pseudomonas sp. AO-1 TaxID=2855434 RepID=UPI001C780CFE|nr:hypothetical protein [Pseudomonas sp. AO-1]QXZ15568.1 hypothetical protein KVQ82_06545 [Pseudomonas sp. AO-1]
MSGFNKNAKKDKFLKQFPEISIGSCDIESRFKINFSFFDDSQEYGSNFAGLEPGVLPDILEKIRGYTRHDLNYWRHRRCGSHGLKILADYGAFPTNSKFIHPKAVPHDVNWCRFRMENLSRLIGFTVPAKLESKKDCHPYDVNTFYLVFIDLHHKFYISEEK